MANLIRMLVSDKMEDKYPILAPSKNDSLTFSQSAVPYDPLNDVVILLASV